MSSSSALEPEDLENVPLVRMEDVQPSRARVVEQVDIVDLDQHEVYETCIIDGVDYDTECLNENVDIGSMVSIKSDGVGDSDDADLIVPEIIEPVVREERGIRINQSDSWPTLEILPGGVIKHADKFEDTVHLEAEEVTLGEMYACAKCSQSFKYLFNLVKHVKSHNDEAKKLKAPDTGKFKSCDNNRYIYVHSVKEKIAVSKLTRKRRPKKKA